jgi:hypothetical protein
MLHRDGFHRESYLFSFNMLGGGLIDSRFRGNDRKGITDKLYQGLLITSNFRTTYRMAGICVLEASWRLLKQPLRVGDVVWDSQKN